MINTEDIEVRVDDRVIHNLTGEENSFSRKL